MARDASGAVVGPVLVGPRVIPPSFGLQAAVRAPRVAVWSSSSGDRARRESGSRARDLGRRQAVARTALPVANRFATLYFFRSFCDPPVDAWLLNHYFVNDTTHSNEKLATSQPQWENDLPGAERDLGLEGKHVPHSGRAYAEAGTYDELLAATGG